MRGLLVAAAVLMAAQGFAGELRKPRVGFLPIATERFRNIGAGTARGTYAERKAKETARMVSDLEAAGYEVVTTGIVWDRDAAGVRQAIDSFVTSRVDCVLETLLSWGEDYAHIRFLRDMPPCPVLFAQRTADEIGLKDTHDEDEFTAYLGHGTLVGSLQASGSNADYDRPMFRTSLGTWKETLARFASFANAARARSILRESRIGLLANFNELMWSTYVNPRDVFRKVGPEVRFLSVMELTDSIAAVTEDEARRMRDAIAAKYELVPGVDDAKFLASVRATIGMERLAAKKGIDLLVLNDADPVLLEKVGLRPGFWPTPECPKNLVVTPEGDVGAGIATFALRLLADGGCVNFIEPFHIDGPEDNFAAGHAGPNDYTHPRGRTKISRDVRFAKTKYRYAGAPFAWHVFAPGEKTMLHCWQAPSGDFRFSSARVECLPTEHFLATYSHGLFRAKDMTNSELFAEILAEGGTQHFAIADGDLRDAVEDLAFLLDFESTRR